MPILLPSDKGTPLAQGDLLEPGRVYATSPDGRPEGTDYLYVLVLSRDCNAIRNESVVVAPVKEFGTEPPFGKEKGKTKEEQPKLSFDKALAYLRELRDGALTPDSIYLGHLPGETQRLTARLDEIATIQVPTDEGRAGWVEEHRRARLHGDFIRALPVRVFASITQVGFDDHTWLPDDDLDIVIIGINNSVRKLEAEIDETKLEIQKKNFGQENVKAKENLEQKLTKQEAKLSELRRTAEPYRAESERRKDSASDRASGRARV